MLEELLGPPGDGARATTRSASWCSPRPTTWGSRPAPTSARSSTRTAVSAGWSSSPASTTSSRASRSRRSPPATAPASGGGAEIAVACDLRVGGSNLRLRFPGGALGVPVGPARLVTLCGLSVAKYLLLTGKEVERRPGAPLGPRPQGRARGRSTEEAALELAADRRRAPARGGRAASSACSTSGTRSRAARGSRARARWSGSAPAPASRFGSRDLRTRPRLQFVP